MTAGCCETAELLSDRMWRPAADWAGLGSTAQCNHRHYSHNWRVREITWGSSPPPPPSSLSLLLLSTELLQLPQLASSAASQQSGHPELGAGGVAFTVGAAPVSPNNETITSLELLSLSQLYRSHCVHCTVHCPPPCSFSSPDLRTISVETRQRHCPAVTEV